MYMSSENSLSNLFQGMDDPGSIVDHCEMMMMMSSHVDGDEFNNLFKSTDLFFDTESSTLIDQKDGNQLISSSGVNPPLIGHKNTTRQLKAENNSGGGWSSSTSSSTSSGRFISFGSSEYDGINTIKPKEEPVALYGDHGSNNITHQGSHHQNHSKRVGSISMCSQEHVLAERRRREKMTQRFLALSALIPGLKKMDKASILADAAKYLKQLEEQVKLLEEQTTKREVVSVVLARKMEDSNLDGVNSSSHDENFYDSVNPHLEIEARASNKNVLIRVHSQKSPGLVQKVLSEVQKLHLTTLNSNTMPFGSNTVDITIIAQMDDEFCMKMKDVVKHLRGALQHFLLSFRS